MSTKEAKKNIAAEKDRRALAQQGIHTKPNTSGKVLSRAFLSNERAKLLQWKRFNPERIADYQFIGAFLNSTLPPGLGVPEVAFLGRSNVGKSSLLNQLCNQRKLARVGKTPGATASVNVYQVLDAKDQPLLGLVDLPGFGYAKLSKTTQESVQRTAERYLANREELALGILLVDIRRVPSDNDKGILAALYDLGLPIVVVATKLDKVKDRNSALRSIREELGLPDGQPYAVSSVTGEGCKGLWSIVSEACETRVAEMKEQFVEESQQEVVEEVVMEDAFDDDEFVYDQGFDWLRGEEVDYETEEDDFEGEYYDKEYVDTSTEAARMSIRDLKQQARSLERKGEV